MEADVENKDLGGDGGLSGTRQAIGRGRSGVNRPLLKSDNTDPSERKQASMVRIWLNPKIKTNKFMNHTKIYLSMVSKFGEDSAAVKNIACIGRDVEECVWLISYKDGIPDDVVGEDIEVNEYMVKISDASVSLRTFTIQRLMKTGSSKNYTQRKKLSKEVYLSYRIQGLPLNITSRQELIDELALHDFKIEKDLHLRQMVDKETKIRTEIVIFQVKFSEELTKKSGEYDLLLDSYWYKTRITCYGYCSECHSPEHLFKDCPERKKIVKSCFHCESEDHVKSECPTLREKKANAVCFNCGQKGHYKQQCVNEKKEIEYETPPWLSNFPNLTETTDVDKIDEKESCERLQEASGLQSKSVVEQNETETIGAWIKELNGINNNGDMNVGGEGDSMVIGVNQFNAEANNEQPLKINKHPLPLDNDGRPPPPELLDNDAKRNREESELTSKDYKKANLNETSSTMDDASPNLNRTSSDES